MNPDLICYGCFEEKGAASICPHCGFNPNEEQPYLALPLGTILNGRYMVGKVLGIGGFGITYLGYDLTLEIKVAIKEYMPSSLATRHPDHYSVTLTGRVETDYQYGMERFLEEARILAKLQNTPNIVSVQNYFKENNTAYFVMEYIDGMSLKAYLASQGDKISYTQALTILQPIMEALIQVHAMNLLHRDISPDNIYITSRGESRLLDFGAARFSLGDDKSVSVILKHGYAPEEQYSSHGNQGPWTDVYAMGATLYRCITGQLPPDAVERNHTDTLQMPSAMGIPVPANVEKALATALALRPEDRFPNMEAFLGALTGKNTVQEQVATSIHQPTQAASFDGKTVPIEPQAKPNGLSGFLKANPVVAALIGGGILVVILLCLILPGVLYGGKDSTPSNTTVETMETPSVSPVAASEEPVVSITPSPSATPSSPLSPAPSETAAPATEMMDQDLGNLSATIRIPSYFIEDPDAWAFYNETKDRIIYITYYWRLEVPIYSLSDIESNVEVVAASFTSGEGLTEPYTITSTSPMEINGQQAFGIDMATTDSDGQPITVKFVAVEGNNGFGCYVLTAIYNEDDAEGAAELEETIHSFQSTGAVDTTTDMFYSQNGGIKFICDGDLAQGGMVEMELTTDQGPRYSVCLYLTEENRDAQWDPQAENAGGVEVMNASHLGSTPEEVLSRFYDSMFINDNALGATASEVYTSTYGNIEWYFQDINLLDYEYSYAAAEIDGQIYSATVMLNDAIEDDALTLWMQIMSTIRPY